MSDKSPAGPSRAPSPSARGTVSRPVGLALSAATALAVVVAGTFLLPPREPEPVPATPATPPPAVAPIGPGAGDGGPGGQAGEAGSDALPIADDAAGAGGAGGAGAPVIAAAPAVDATAPADGPDEAADAAAAIQAMNEAASEATADCTLAEKDIAREAWRRNWPTICPVAEGEKAFIVIPIKGAIDGAIVELRRKPNREARVSLPEAESLLTMKQYKLRRLGFKELKIGPMDETGTRFRVKLQTGAGDPVFEVKDGYAKITVATPTKD
jgi:hypothetical protein